MKNITNREIKFRAWDKQREVWVHQEEFKINGLGKTVWTLLPSFIDEIILQQYTGLLYKNGKEIYEGDIVYHVEDVIVEVISGHERREPEGIFTEIKIPDIYTQIGDDLPDSDELEIIGNIYENPNLLK